MALYMCLQAEQQFGRQSIERKQSVVVSGTSEVQARYSLASILTTAPKAEGAKPHKLTPFLCCWSHFELNRTTALGNQPLGGATHAGVDPGLVFQPRLSSSKLGFRNCSVSAGLMVPRCWIV